MPPRKFSNWNKSQQCNPGAVYFPTSTEQIQKIVRNACVSKQRIRVVGRGVHTYGSISMCDTSDIIIDLRNYNKVLDIDKTQKTVTAQAGIALEELIPHIEDKKVRLALRNMGEITEQCLGGVTATGTHGSGGGPSGAADSFSDQVVAFKIMECTREAAVRTITTESRNFNSFQTHLGTLAIVLEVTLQLVDWYFLEWKSFEIGNFSELTTDAIQKRYRDVYSLSYSYFPSTDEIVEVTRDLSDITKESGIAADVKDEFITTLRQGASRFLRVFPYLIKPYASFQKKALLTLKGSDSWRKVLSQGDLWGGTNLTLLTDAEYAVPIESTLQALAQIRRILRSTGYSKRTLCVVGIRFVRGSTALMASHFSSNTNDVFAYINVQFRTKAPARSVVNLIQKEMMLLGGRPHWGKLNTTTRTMIDSCTLWPSKNLEDFLLTKAEYDPYNLLGNKYLDRALGIDVQEQSRTTNPKDLPPELRTIESQKGIEIETASF